MKINAVFAIIMLLCVVLTSCGAEGIGGDQTDKKMTEQTQTSISKSLQYENISLEEAKKRLDHENGIILLDVRTQEEYAEKHIPNSLLIPVDVIEQEAPAKLADKNAVILVYCRSGRRSITASEALVKMGYARVYNLGGINDWPYETESGQ